MTSSRPSMLSVLVLIAALAVVSVTACERSVPEPPTPTPELVFSPQPPPPTEGAVPTVISVLEEPREGTATPTIRWDLPTFTPTPETGPAATATPVPPTATPVSTATPVPQAAEGTTISYTVDWGDTLYTLAAQYDTTVAAIVAANNLPNENFIRVGQELQIPVGASGPVSAPGGTQTMHVVQAGETLYGLASRYGTTVAAIAQANGIINPGFVRAGTQLVIPSGGGTQPQQTSTVYTVQPGDTLSSIAARFGTSYWAIAQANGLPNSNFIRAGQTLIIPAQ